MAPPYTGRCFCEAVQYRITEEPLTFYACHCTDCQKRSGSAFGLSMWVNRSAIAVTHGDAALQISSGHDDRLRHGRLRTIGRRARSPGSSFRRASCAMQRSPMT